MQNDLKYTVRSREIIDLVSAMRSARLTLSPYFQRNLVWRDTHKRDFIDTILKGYPFPQIFLARGPIDLDTMQASQAVVDGQQRLNTIREFINGNLTVDGKVFKDLTTSEREIFLKYEVPVIDFDLDAGDERLKDVFRRLNRTFYSLSAIEKLASEYSASEFMLVARALSGEISNEVSDSDELGDVGSEDGNLEVLASNLFSKDPGIDEKTWEWVIQTADGPFSKLVRAKSIFTAFEFDRKVPLMFTLNLMCTFMDGYYQRNDRVRKYLDEKAQDFPEHDEVITAINDSAEFISGIDIPDSSMWWNKANFFSLAVELSRNATLRQLPQDEARKRLLEFSRQVPDDYTLAARESVGRKAQRELRGKAIRELLS
ncbi:MAG: DUF262 domain-containing protein [Alphaproteobacteria bacterium]